ncbi:MAG: hypothetical protein ACYDGR_16625 [Candidatus Dormibacteria bacterium]
MAPRFLIRGATRQRIRVMAIEDTIHAIRSAERERLRRLAENRRLRLPVAQVDATLSELEEIHLRGGIKVPAAMIPRIEALVRSLPEDYRLEFPLRTNITRVMDHLYAIQDRLLSRKDCRRLVLQQIDVEFEQGTRHPAA